jgi:hypothetical protein
MALEVGMILSNREQEAAAWEGDGDRKSSLGCFC